MIKRIFINKKGSGISVILAGVVIIMSIITTISGTMHNKILLSQQMRIKDALESATRAAMKCIDITDFENLERISRGDFGDIGENYISLDMEEAYEKFIKMVALGIPDSEENVRNHLILISSEPTGINSFKVTVKSKTDTIVQDMNVVDGYDLENRINQLVNLVIGEREEDEEVERVDIKVLLEEQGLYESVLDTNQHNTFLISILYDYEINGIFPIIDIKQGVVSKRRYNTGMFGVLKHIRKVWESE